MRAPLVALALLATAVAGCTTTRPVAQARAAMVARGQSFAQRACAGCHSVGHGGESPNPHAPPFRVLAAQRSDAKLGDALSEISRGGHLEMPPIYDGGRGGLYALSDRARDLTFVSRAAV